MCHIRKELPFAKLLKYGKLNNLKEVVFGEDNFGDEEATEVAFAIKNGSLPNLETLRFAYSNISDKGAVAIAKAIESGNSKNIKELEFCATRVLDNGSCAIADAIKRGKLQKLKILSLGDISGCKCVNYLAQAQLANLERIYFIPEEKDAIDIAKIAKTWKAPKLKTIVFGIDASKTTEDYVKSILKVNVIFTPYN